MTCAVNYFVSESHSVTFVCTYMGNRKRGLFVFFCPWGKGASHGVILLYGENGLLIDPTILRLIRVT